MDKGFFDNISHEFISQENGEAISEASPDDSTVSADLPAEKKKGLFARLTEGLSKTRNNFLDSVDSVLKSFQKVDEELIEELEETLIMSDFGYSATEEIVSNLRERIKADKIASAEDVKSSLVGIISDMLTKEESAETFKTPCVMLVVGVNGVGKTTTIGKLASKYASEGMKVIVAAADTFRAAAIDQLEIWAKRAGVEIIKQSDGSDPGAVVFDALNAAKARKADILICDTAGRLHNKKNLMDELGKINKIIEGQYPNAHKETYIVLDATAGQNSLLQVKAFKEVCDITGIILTKLDGTAKGGIIAAIKSELSVPVRFIGVGEGVSDLQQFNPRQFAEALFYGDKK